MADTTRAMTPNVWTLEALRQHLESVIDERDRQYGQRFVDSQAAVSAALTASKEAVLKAEAATERRFEAANEFRSQLSDQASLFMPRAETQERMRTIEERLGKLEKVAERGAGHGAGLRDGWGYLVGGAGVALAVLSLIVALVIR